MTQEEAIKKMNSVTNIEITPEFRKFWNKPNLGRWFYIQSVGISTACIVSESSHQIFENASLTSLK